MTACADLQCRNCPQPGKCCSWFNIDVPATRPLRHPLEVYAWLASVVHDDPAMGDTGLPFLPLHRRASDDWLAAGGNAEWRFWCPRLGRDGRCTDYEHRPKLCRLYEPGTDRLCALHTPAPQAEWRIALQSSSTPTEAPPMTPNPDPAVGPTTISVAAGSPEARELHLLRSRLRGATKLDNGDRALTVRQLLVLLDLRLDGPKSTGELAGDQIKSSVTRAIANLEARGFVTNTRNPDRGTDRRRNKVCLTEAGLQLVSEAAGVPGAAAA